MGKIDYESYMAGLGDFETNQINRIKKYLEDLCEKDECLKALYRPEKIKDCYDFILECAKKKMTRDGNLGVSMIEDSLGYKMARDFFIEILPKILEDAPEEAEEEKEEEPCNQDEVGETSEAPEIKALEPNKEDDVFLSGQAFNAGDIIDKHGRRIFFKDLMPGMRFVRADYPDSLQYMVVCVVKNIKENRFSYDNNEHDISRYSYDSKDYFDSETSECGGFGYAVPGDAMIIGKIENGERKLFEEAVAATASYDSEGNGLLFGF